MLKNNIYYEEMTDVVLGWSITTCPSESWNIYNPITPVQIFLFSNAIEFYSSFEDKCFV